MTALYPESPVDSPLIWSMKYSFSESDRKFSIPAHSSPSPRREQGAGAGG